MAFTSALGLALVGAGTAGIVKAADPDDMHTVAHTTAAARVVIGTHIVTALTDRRH